jgi:hypothetical protein
LNQVSSLLKREMDGARTAPALTSINHTDTIAHYGIPPCIMTYTTSLLTTLQSLLPFLHNMYEIPKSREKLMSDLIMERSYGGFRTSACCLTL